MSKPRSDKLILLLSSATALLLCGVSSAGILITHMETIGSTFSPDGDGFLDSLRVNFTLSDSAYYVRSSVAPVSSPQSPIAFPFGPSEIGAGDHSFHWDGRDSTGAPVQEGRYIVSLRAVNAVFDETEAETVGVDLTGPTVVITRVDPGIFAPDIPTNPSRLTVEFSVSGSPPGEGDEVTIGVNSPSGTEIASLFPETTFDGDGLYKAYWDGSGAAVDGIYSIEVMVKDNAGHSGSDWSSIDYDLDPPEIEISSLEDNEQLRQLPDSLSGRAWDRHGIVLDSLLVQYPDSEFVPVPSKSLAGDSVRFSFPLGSVLTEEAEHVLFVRARDTVGRTSRISFRVTLDTTPPIAPVLDPRPSVVRSPEITITGRAEGAPSYVELLRNSVAVDSIPAFIGPEFAFQIVLLPGANAIQAISRDPAGNVSPPSETLEIYFDDSPGLSLEQPFAPGDPFVVNLPRQPETVTLRIYDLGGNPVFQTTVRPNSSSFSIVWDGKNGDGETALRGPLVVVLQASYPNGGEEILREAFLFEP